MIPLIYKTLYGIGKMIPTHGIPVLLYHSVSDSGWLGSVKPTEFDKQMHWIAKHFNPITADQFAQWYAGQINVPDNPILITFDDGYEDNLQSALPIMRTLGIKAVIFPITGEVPVPFNGLKRLSWENLRHLNEAGWEIGCHTHTHRKMTELTVTEIGEEIRESLHLLKQHSLQPASMIAYPKGKLNSQVVDITRQYFQLGWGVEPGYNNRTTDPYNLKRCGVMRSTSFSAFKMHLTPMVSIIHKIMNGS